MFIGNTIYSNTALSTQVPVNLMLEATPQRKASHPGGGGGVRNTPSHRISSDLMGCLACRKNSTTYTFQQYLETDDAVLPSAFLVLLKVITPTRIVHSCDT